MTLAEKQRFLLDNGFNPAEHDLMDDGTVVPKSAAPQPSPTQVRSKTSDAFIHGAERNIGSGLGGALGAGGALAAGAAIAGGPLTMLPALGIALAGGLGGSYLGGKAQQALTPEETLRRQQAQAAQETAEHPIAATLGEMAPGLVPFGPNIKGLQAASKLARLEGVTLSAPERAAMAQIPVNAALGAGLDVGQSLATGQEIDPRRVALSAAAQGLLSEPNVIGRNIGFHAAPSEVKRFEPMEGDVAAGNRIFAEDVGALREKSLENLENQRIAADRIRSEREALDEQLRQKQYEQQRAKDAQLVEQMAAYKQQDAITRGTEPLSKRLEQDVNLETEAKLKAWQDMMAAQEMESQDPLRHLMTAEEVRAVKGGPNLATLETTVEPAGRLPRTVKARYDVDPLLQGFPEVKQEVPASKAADLPLTSAELKRSVVEQLIGEAPAPVPVPAPASVPVRNKANEAIALAVEQQKKDIGVDNLRKNLEYLKTNPHAAGVIEKLGANIPHDELKLRSEAAQLEANRQFNNLEEAKAAEAERAAAIRVKRNEAERILREEAAREEAAIKANPELAEAYKIKPPTPEVKPTPKVTPAPQIKPTTAPEVKNKIAAEAAAKINAKLAEPAKVTPDVKPTPAAEPAKSQALTISPEEFKAYSEDEKDMFAGALAKEAAKKYGVSLEAAEKLIEKTYGYDRFQVGDTPRTMTQAQAEAANQLAQKRGLPAPKWVKEIVTERAEKARGKIDLTTGQIELSLAHAAPDTGLHEIAHAWLSDKMNDPRVKRALEANGWDGKPETLAAAEEKLTQRLGEEGFNRGKNKSFWRDLKDHVVNRLGFGDSGSYERQLAGRLIEDAPSKFTPSEGKRYSTGTAAAAEVEKEKTIPFLESIVDRVGNKYPELKEGAKKFFASKDEYIGKFGNDVRRQLSKFSPEDVNETFKQHYEIYHGDRAESDFTGNREVSDILKNWAKSTAEEQRTVGMKIDDRERGVNEWYTPAMLNMESLGKLTNPAQADQVKADWINHLVSKGMSEEDAAKHVNDFTNAINSDKTNYRAINFGALRRAAGLGLPENLRETRADDLIRRYANRYASDLSFYKNLEEPHGEKLGLKNGPGVSIDSDVKDMMRGVLNNWDSGARVGQMRLQSLVRAASNAALGAATGVRDTLSIPVNAMPYIGPVDFINAGFKALANYKEHSIEALRANAKQLNNDQFTWGNLEHPDAVVDRVNKISNMLRKWQGREAIEDFNRTFTFGLGKEIAKMKMMEGDTKFFEKFGLNTEGRSSDEVLNQVAKNFTDANQGSYNITNLPAWVHDSKLSPFFALSKWSIEKSNEINRSVINPMRKGDYMPFLRYTLGAYLTGSVINEMNKVMKGGKKSADATVEEAAAGGGAGDIAHAVFNTMQMGGYVGIVSDLVKATSDVAIKGKAPQGLSFPLVDAFQHGIVDNVAHFRAAVDNGEDPVKAAIDLAASIGESHVQNLGYLSKNTWRQEDVARQNKQRDLNVYRELQGEPTSSATKDFNPALNSQEREFAHEGDLTKAAEMVPKLIEKLVSRYGNNPEKLKQKINALGNTPGSMPDFETEPITAAGYYQYLARAYGPEEAKNRLIEFAQEKAVKGVKKSMLPKI